jgi:nucleotide-binding universal stress UspA family protein
VFRNILVAIDSSPSAEAALDEAIDLARAAKGRLVLITVAEPPRWRYSGPQYVPYPSDAELELAARHVVEHAEALVPNDVPVTSIVRTGRPADAIVARAVEGGHDLVVLGSRGFGPVRSLLCGSVSRTVAARCPVPVLVAHPPRPGARGGSCDSGLGVVPAERSGAVSVRAEPTDKGAPVLFLWLVAAVLLELQLALWILDGLVAP